MKKADRDQKWWSL